MVAAVFGLFRSSLGGGSDQSCTLAGQRHLADPQHLLFVALHEEQHGGNLQGVKKATHRGENKF